MYFRYLQLKSNAASFVVPRSDSTAMEQPPLFSVLGKSNNVCGRGGTGGEEEGRVGEIDSEQGPVARAPTEMKGMRKDGKS